MSMQETQRFASRVVKLCDVVFCSLMKERVVLGMEYSRHLPSSSSLCEVARLVCTSTCFLWPAELVGGLQKMTMVRTILRLEGSSSKIQLH